jgi:hypothetical protein
LAGDQLVTVGDTFRNRRNACCTFSDVSLEENIAMIGVVDPEFRIRIQIQGLKIF